MPEHRPNKHAVSSLQKSRPDEHGKAADEHTRTEFLKCIGFHYCLLYGEKRAIVVVVGFYVFPKLAFIIAITT